MFDFFRDHLDQIYNFVSIAVAVTSIVCTFVLSRKKQSASRFLEVLEELPQVVAFAECLFGSGHGTEKLRLVLSTLKSRCNQLGIKYDETYLTEQIEKVLTAPSSHYKKEVKQNEEKTDEK